MKTNTTSVVSKAARELKAKDEETGLILLSTGVRLKPSMIPNMIYMEVMARFEQPKVPRVMNEDLGREEENPSHPDYIRAMQEWQLEASKGVIDMMILFGTELYSVPEELDGPDTNSWVKKLKLAGISFDDTDEYARYLMWVKTVAAPSDADTEAIMTGVGRLSGVLESDVSDATSQFRN